MLKIILPIVGFLLLAALWRWTRLGEWPDFDAAIAAIAWIKQQPYTPILVPVFYVAGGLIAFPVILMIIATVIIFGPWQGFFYSMLGAELSALSLFFIGHWLGRKR
jgi:phospholipase D1/2